MINCRILFHFTLSLLCVIHQRIIINPLHTSLQPVLNELNLRFLLFLDRIQPILHSLNDSFLFLLHILLLLSLHTLLNDLLFLLNSFMFLLDLQPLLLLGSLLVLLLLLLESGGDDSLPPGGELDRVELDAVVVRSLVRLGGRAVLAAGTICFWRLWTGLYVRYLRYRDG